MDPVAGMLKQYEAMLRTLLHSMGFCAVVLAILLASTFHSFSHLPSHRAVNDSIRLHPSKWQGFLVCFNGVSFFSAVCGLLLFAGCAFSHLTLPVSQDLLSIDKKMATLLKRLAITLAKAIYVFLFLMLSIVCCALAYVFTGLATVGEARSERIPVLLLTAVGSFVSIQAIFVSVRDMTELGRAISESHAELWLAVKTETLFGRTFAKFVEISRGTKSTASTSSSWDERSRKANGTGFDQAETS